MRRAASAFVVTALVVVAGIWLREQGAPLDGGDRVWSSRDPLLRGVSSVVATGEQHTVVQAAEQPPVLVDRRDGLALRLRGSQVLGISQGGTAVTFAEGTLYGDHPSGRTWSKAAGPLLGGRTPHFLGSDGTVVAIAGCRGRQGVVLGLDLDDGRQVWQVDGPCAVPPVSPSATQQYFVATQPAQMLSDGPAVNAFLHDISDGRRVAAFDRVRDVHLVGEHLLVLDADHQLSAHQGTEPRWLLDPDTAALADAPAVDLAEAYDGTPAVVFADRSRALVDAGSGTLRRAREWARGQAARGEEPAVAHGREHLWSDRSLVVRNVFTGRELWRTELPAGSASAAVSDRDVVVVTVTLTDGLRQVFALDALSGERLSRSRRTEEVWRLLPTGGGTLLATNSARHHLLAVTR